MTTNQGNIYEDESELLKKAILISKNNDLSKEELLVEYKKLTHAFEELLSNTILITNISDRFQEKYKSANEKLKIQADIISKANLQLETDNRTLKNNLKNLNKEAAFIQAVDYEYFQSMFPNKNACLEYLSEIKWTDGYQCKRCTNTKYCDGNSFLSRRCTKCRYDESATAYTIFHKCKFPLTKALYLTILIHHHRDEVSSYELGRRLDLRQKTCWSFRKRVLDAIEENHIGLERTVRSWTKLILSNSDD